MTYEFNENGVCMSPDKVILSNSHVKCELKIAFNGEKWVSGHHIMASNGGGCSSPCSGKWGTYNTKEEALDAAVEECKFSIPHFKGLKELLDGYQYRTQELF